MKVDIVLIVVGGLVAIAALIGIGAETHNKQVFAQECNQRGGIAKKVDGILNCVIEKKGVSHD